MQPPPAPARGSLSGPVASAGSSLPPTESIERDVTVALAEDIGSGDITSDLVPESATAQARVVTNESMILCGCAWFEACFHALSPSVRITWNAVDGASCAAGMTLCLVTGPARALLAGERTALNFLQTLSGTATTTAQYVEALRGTRARVLDTRKTLPGLRSAQKYAVRTGGGTNHRMGLHDAILIKENHVAAAGSIGAAISRARKHHPGVPLEVEVENFSELRQALAAGADRIMLDDFERDDLARAVREVDGRAELEVSGSVALDALRVIAETGVDFISIGALTKHVRAIDLSMRIETIGAQPGPVA